MLGELANTLLADAGVTRAAIITSPGTGNPAVEAFDLLRVHFAVSLQYQSTDEIEELISFGAATFDLVVVDPLHTYESSMQCYERSLELLRPGGLLLSHDCVPPPEITQPQFTRGNWSGVTFAAFRDVMSARQVPWFTLAADFGIGVALADHRSDTDEFVDEFPVWSQETHDRYIEQYQRDPFGAMRTVRAEAWPEAIRRLRAGLPLNDLAATFETWDDVLPPVTRARRAAQAAAAGGASPATPSVSTPATGSSAP